MAFTKDDVIPVKEAFKWIMQGLIAKELGGVTVVTKVSKIQPQRAELHVFHIKDEKHLSFTDNKRMCTSLFTQRQSIRQFVFCCNDPELTLCFQSLFEVGVEFTHPETDSDCHFL